MYQVIRGLMLMQQVTRGLMLMHQLHLLSNDSLQYLEMGVATSIVTNQLIFTLGKFLFMKFRVWLQITYLNNKCILVASPLQNCSVDW